MAFEEILFPNVFTVITGGGPRFVTFRTETRSGAETAVSVRNFPKFSWNGSASNITQAKFEELLSFFVGRLGSFNGFRFNDPRDYLIGRSVRGVEAPVATSQLTTTAFQIVRPYTYGAMTVNVPIYKIVADSLTNIISIGENSTVRVYQADGVTEVTSGWSVNVTTGVIIFAVAPGYVPKVSCEFHWPVRFDTDELPTTYTDFIIGANSVTLKQITQL